MSGESKALLVGMSSYQDVEYDLPSSLADVEAMASGLETHINGSLNFEVQQLLSTPADPVTTERLLSAVDVFLDESAKGKNVFYFTGHADITPYGLHLGTSDGMSSSVVGVSFDALMHRINKADFEQLLIVLDCCFSGAAGNLARPDDLGRAIDFALLRENVTILASSSSKRSSLAGEDDKTLSEFTKSIVEALSGVRGGASITPIDMYSHAATSFSDNGAPVLKTHASEPFILRQI